MSSKLLKAETRFRAWPIAVIALGALPLAGCLNLERRSGPEAQAAAVADDDAFCQRNGVKQGSPEYVACRRDRDNSSTSAERSAERAHSRMVDQMTSGR